MNKQWSDKYKRSIDCDNPKGFSQKAHCQGRKKSFKEMREYLMPIGIGPIDTFKPMVTANPGIVKANKEELSPFKKKILQKLAKPIKDYNKKKENVKEGMIPWLDNLIIKIKSQTTLKSRYQYAAKVLQDVIDRKKKERAKEGLPLRHDIGYYAARIADTINDIDARTLQKMVHEKKV